MGATARTLDTTYSGGYVALGGEYALFPQLASSLGLRSFLRARVGVYDAHTDYDGTFEQDFDQAFAAVEPISSRLSLSDDKATVIAGLSFETRKQFGPRTSLSLLSEYEWYSSVPDMRYNDADEFQEGVLPGKIEGTRIDYDDVFGMRTMLTLKISLGPAILYKPQHPPVQPLQPGLRQEGKEGKTGTTTPAPTEAAGRQLPSDLFKKDASQCNCGAFVTNLVSNAELGNMDKMHLAAFQATYTKRADQTKPKVGDVVVYGYVPEGDTWFEHMALVVKANGEVKVIGISKKGGKIVLSSVKGQWLESSSVTYFTPKAGVADTTAEQKTAKEKDAAYQNDKTEANKAAADKAWADLVNKALTPK